MKAKCVYLLRYLNRAGQEDHELFVASNINEAFERGKQLFKKLNGRQILRINFYQKIWI